MNKQQILNITGLTEKEFYSRYPDQESFCNDYPQACAQLAQAAEGIEVTGSLTSPEEVQKLGKAYGFRTDSNKNFQQDMYNYVAKNKPELFKESISKFGPANAGLTNYGSVQGYRPDAYIGPRVADMMGRLGTLQAPRQPQAPKYVEYNNANVRQQYDFNRGMQQKYVGSNVAPTPIPSQPAFPTMPATFPGQQLVGGYAQNPAGGWNIGPAQAPSQPGMPARQQAPTQGGQPQMSHMGPWHTNPQGEYTRYYTNQQGDMNPGLTPGAALGQQAYGGMMAKGGPVNFATRQDSIDVLNSQLAQNAYYAKLNKYYSSKKTERQNYVKDFEDSYKDKSSIDAELRNSRLMLQNAEKYKKIYYNKLPSTVNQLKEKAAQYIKYAKSEGKDKYHYIDLITGDINYDAPFALFNSKIKPKGIIKRDFVSEMPGKEVSTWEYDPLAVTPVDMLTSEQKILREKIYGPQSYSKRNVINSVLEDIKPNENINLNTIPSIQQKELKSVYNEQPEMFKITNQKVSLKEPEHFLDISKPDGTGIQRIYFNSKKELEDFDKENAMLRTGSFSRAETYSKKAYGGEMIKRADGSYSKRGLWDNIRANKGSGKKPTKEMLEQERKIRNEYAYGGYYAKGGGVKKSAVPMVNPYTEVDSESADMFRKLMPFPSNFSQMLAKVALKDARMSNSSLSDDQKLILWNTIQNAMKRSGVNSGGGTEYQDYGNQGYGTSDDYNNWFNRGQIGFFGGALKSVANPGFNLASTIGRGRYWQDSKNPDDIYYTDVYDWNPGESNFKGTNTYQALRNNLRAGEDTQLNKQKNDNYRMNFKLSKSEIDQIRKKKEMEEKRTLGLGVKEFDNGGEMALGGEQDETQQSIMAALKQGMKPQEILKKLVAMGLTKEQATAYIQSAVAHPGSQYDNTYVNDSSYNYMDDGGEMAQGGNIEDYGGGMFAYGGIHLDPAKKGTFKAQATRMGMSVQQAASHILANKEDYSPAMVKKANFAKNFAKKEGGQIMMALGGEPNGGMALGQMSAVVDKMSKLRKFVSPDQNLDPWIASKLAVMDDSADAISDYMMYNPEAQGREDMMAYGGVFAEGGSFGKAFADARRELGAGKTFIWKGKEYSTNYANEDSDEIETPVKPANLVKKENNQNANLKTVINNPKMNGAVNGFMQRNLPAVPVDNTYVQNQRANYYNNNLLIPIPVKKQNGYETRSILNLMGDSRYLESGMIEDKNQNLMYVMQNGKVVKTFPIMTGLNKNGNINDKGLDWMESHPVEAAKMRATPVGTYFSSPANNLYGKKGFRMTAIPAFGQPAPLAKDLAQHVVYGNAPVGEHGHDPAEYARRLKIMKGPGVNRVGSYGCTNMYGEDIDCLTGELFPKGDTTIVVDTRNPKDKKFINTLLNQNEYGGEPQNAGFQALPDYVQEKIMGNMAEGGELDMYGSGGYVVKRSNARKGKTHVVIGPDGTKKYFGDPNLGQHPKDPERKKAFYARHKHNLEHNPYFRAYARATWAEGGEIGEYKHGGYVGMDGKFHMAKGSGTFSGNAYYVNGGEEDSNLTDPYDGSNPNAPLPPFDPSAYQAMQLPTGYVGYSKKDPATGQFVPIDNVRKDDLWKHLSGSQRWNTGQTVTQKVGRAAGKVGDVLNTALVGAEGYSNYLKNNEAQNEYNNYTQNMGTTASLYGINAPAASRGDYSVTGSTYGTLKPNQYRQYSKMGGAIDQYAGGGGYISDELKFNNMDAPMVFTEGLANASNTYSTPDNTTVDRRFTPRMLPFNNEDDQTSYAKSGTDIATKLNNPTNMIYHPWMSKLGAQRSNIKQQDGDGFFAHFPDIDTALKAYETQLFGEVDGVFDSRYYKPNTTVDKALRTWSGNGYGGNIYPEIANKPLSSVTAAERRELAKRQIKSESGAMYSKLKSKGYFEMGGSYQEGGIVEMSDAEIKQFLANGGQLEFLD